MRSRLLALSLLTLGWLYLALLFCQPIHFVTADLGRHLINGQLLRADGLQSAVLSTNYYAATEGETPFINHHWLFGLVVATIAQVTGFTGLSFFFILSSTVTILLALNLARRRAGWRASLLSLWLILPLLTTRLEVRPELFSGWFFISSLTLLQLFREKRLSFRTLLLGQAWLQFFWVNLHLFFFFNWLIIFIWILTEHRRWREGFILLALILGVSLLNPAGLAGALMPFTIFQNYQYPVAENVGLLTLLLGYRENLSLVHYYVFAVILISLGGLGAHLFEASLAARSGISRLKPGELGFILLSLGLGLGTLAIFRLLPFFALVLIPTLASGWSRLPWHRFEARLRLHLPSWAHLTNAKAGHLELTILLSIVLASLALFPTLFLPAWKQLGLGLKPETQAALQALQTRLQPPLFNNYDLGGFLIYALYPRLAVYTDNRPEAYPPGFFPERYIKPQLDEEAWQALLAKEQFQSIAFAWQESSDWGRAFLQRRLDDPEWVPVYLDSSILILLRHSAINEELIRRWQLPREHLDQSPLFDHLNQAAD